MRKIAVLVVLLGLWSVPAFAQTYTLEITAPGATAPNPAWTQTFPMSAFTCGQKPKYVQTAADANPTKVVIDDPSDKTADCVATLATTFLPALPTGAGYVPTISRTETIGGVTTTLRSAAGLPFSRLGSAVPPTGLRVGR